MYPQFVWECRHQWLPFYWLLVKKVKDVFFLKGVVFGKGAELGDGFTYDLNEDGTGAPRGFDVIDTDTGKHEFVDLTKEPYNIPTFNQIDLDHDNSFDVTKIKHNYYKLTTQDKDKYEKLSKLIQDNQLANQIQLLYIPFIITY